MKFKEAVECLAKAGLRDEFDMLLNYRRVKGRSNGWDTWVMPQLGDHVVRLLAENGSALAKALV